MDYEKKYENSLDAAKKIYANMKECGNFSGMEDLEVIFPELAESEDEKIRKRIVVDLRSDLEEIYAKFSGDYDDRDADDMERQKYLENALAWLEKQGEQKPYDNATIVVHHGFVPKSATEAAKEEKVDNQNCVKPTNKVEPKFHEGDWIVGANNIFKIISLSNELNCYIAVTVNNEKVKIPYYFDDGQGHMCSYHLWTIQDAKDGDILIYPDGTFACFDKILQKGLYLASLIVEPNGTIRNNDSCCVLNVQPITKEQREFFHERGNVWSHLFATKPEEPVVEDLNYEYE